MTGAAAAEAANSPRNSVRSTDTSKPRAKRAEGQRQRVSQACVNCRRRKIKCRGLGRNGTCDSCAALSKECILVSNGDGRRTGSKKRASQLHARIQSLESVLAAHGLQFDPTSQDDHSENQTSILDDVLPETEDAPSAVDHLANGFYSPDMVLSLPVSGDQAPANEFFNTLSTLATQSFELSYAALPNHEQITTAPSPVTVVNTNQPLNLPSNLTSNVGSAASEFPDKEAHTDISARRLPMAALPDHLSTGGTHEFNIDAADSQLKVDGTLGQTRYYGLTARPYIRNIQGQQQTSDLSNVDKSKAGKLDLDAIPIIESLLQIFFQAQPLTIIIVDQTTFEHDRRVGLRTEWWSPFLQNAILACAARMSPAVEVRRLGAKYAKRAKADILEELESSNISSLQGFALLSDFESTRGCVRLGYMYCGIACRLVFDLGLAECCISLVAQGKMTQYEQEQRHTLLLAMYVCDKVWGVYLGRPSTIQSEVVAQAQQRMLSQGWQCPASLEQWMGLCTDMSEATEVLHTFPLHGYDIIERLLEVDKKLRHRYDSLPTLLHLDPHNICGLHPSAYTLQLQFYGLRIILHYFIRRTTRANGQSPEARCESSKVIYDSAITIARLVNTYEQIYGIQNVVTVMLDSMYISAGALSSCTVHRRDNEFRASDSAHLYWLGVLAEYMWKLQSHYPVVATIRASLSELVNGTPLAGLFNDPVNGRPHQYIDLGNSSTSHIAPPSPPAQVIAVEDSQDGYVGGDMQFGSLDDALSHEIFGNIDDLGSFNCQPASGPSYEWMLLSLPT